MAKYKVLELSLINDKLCEPGEIVEYSGKPGPNLQKVGSSKPAPPTDNPEELSNIEGSRNSHFKQLKHDNL